MTEKLFYWAENLEDYSSDNEQDYNQIIEIKRLNFFIGKNNAGKSRFLRNLYSSEQFIDNYFNIDFKKEFQMINKVINSTQIYRQANSSDMQRFTNFNSTNANISEFLIIGKIIDSYNNYRITKLSEFLSFIDKLEKATIGKYFCDIQLQEPAFTEIIKFIKIKVEKFREKNANTGKYYIPILRGMRPISESTDFFPYIRQLA